MSQIHMQWWRFSRLVVCAILTTLSPNLQAFSCRVTVSFQFWNNQLSSGIKYQRKAYLIVYSSWQWTNKLTFIKTFQNTAGLIWCVQYAVQTFDKCISFVEKQVWPDHVMCFRECFSDPGLTLVWSGLVWSGLDEYSNIFEYSCNFQYKYLLGHSFVSKKLIWINSDIHSCNFVSTNIFGHSFLSKFSRMSHSDLEQGGTENISGPGIELDQQSI